MSNGDNKLSWKVAEVELIYNSKVKATDRPKITCSKDAELVLRDNWNNSQISLREEFNALYLDRQHRVLGFYNVCKGGISATLVDVRLAFIAALKLKSSAMIIAHNHPSGNLKPSQADINLTDKFKQAGEVLDIGVIEHIILTPDAGYYSFADEGLM